MINIIPAHDKKTFKEFLSVPFHLYENAPHWTPPLLKDVKDLFSDKNPFFCHAEVQPFIAKKNGRTVGRITAVLNEAHNDFHGDTTGFFGFFDSIDDRDVAAELFQSVRQWLRERGRTVMRGPMNFSSNEEWGVLIENFDEPAMVMMPYSLPYYGRLLENCGLSKAKDLYAYTAPVPDEFPDKVYRVARIAEKRGISVRHINLKRFSEEMKIFKSIYDAAWNNNWGFTPLTDDEIDHMAKQLKPIIVPELTLIAEMNGEPVGFMMFLPDFNFVLKKMNGRLLPFGVLQALWYSRNITDARLLLLGLKEGFRRRGVDSLLFIEGLKGLKRKGFKRMEFSWILEDNVPVQRIIETMQGRLYKKYRVYEGQV